MNLVRIFSDGDFVFGHTEYHFDSDRVGFEVFRFEGDFTVEHWDNIQPRRGPNPAGRSMTDGGTEVVDRDRTEPNRELVRAFVETVLVAKDLARLGDFVDLDYAEQNPRLVDGAENLRVALARTGDDGVRYQTLHRLLADSNFVLSVCEGYRGDVHTSFYDLYRVAGGKIVEHWDTTETVPPKSEWKNDNGKF